MFERLNLSEHERRTLLALEPRIDGASEAQLAAGSDLSLEDTRRALSGLDGLGLVWSSGYGDAEQPFEVSWQLKDRGKRAARELRASSGAGSEVALAAAGSRTPVVLTLHGIRTKGLWQDSLEEPLHDAGFVCGTLKYGYFTTARFLTKYSRRRQVDWFRDQYAAAAAEGRPVSLIAHSFGTYLATRAMEIYPEIRFQRMILCGSIVQTDFPWTHLVTRGQIEEVLHDYGGQDVWTSLVAWFVEDAGPSGFCGFKDDAQGKIIQRRLPEFRHSDFFYRLNVERNWLPFLGGRAPELIPPLPSRPFNWRFALVRALVIVAILLAAVLAVRSRPGERRSAPPQLGPIQVPAPRPPSNAYVPVALHQCAFDTITLDEFGRVRERKRLGGECYTEDLGDGATMEFVAIPGGRFRMGSPRSEHDHAPDESPEHDVDVGAFFLGRYETTQAQWRAVAGLPRIAIDLELDPAKFKGATRPVERISWEEAGEFCQRLQSKTGRSYRLPSEAEWEYAARAGSAEPFAFGATLTPAVATYDDSNPYANAVRGVGHAETTAVGSTNIANAFGLYDIHGNVWEWTMDVWHDNYVGAPTDARPWDERSGAHIRVLRGGAWRTPASDCRSALRAYAAVTDKKFHIGLRVAWSQR